MTNIKYNLSILKGKKVGLLIEEHTPVTFIVTDIKQTPYSIEFLTNDTNLEINKEFFSHLMVRKVKDTIWFIKSSKYVSPFIGFTMFDTYGFPVELTEEILEGNGHSFDREGYEILKELQKEKSKGTYKDKNNVFEGEIK